MYDVLNIEFQIFSTEKTSSMNRTFQVTGLLRSCLISLILMPFALTKVVQIIKCTCTVSLITSEIFEPTHRYRYQFEGEVMTDI